MSAESDGSLQVTAQFLGCDKKELNAALVSRVMQTPVGGRRGSSIMYISDFCFSCELCMSVSSSYLHCVAATSSRLFGVDVDIHDKVVWQVKCLESDMTKIVQMS